VTVVVVGLQTVGVVLVVATLVTPAAAARQWTERLGVMLALAALVGGGAGAVGALVSASAPRLPTGPVIVLCSSVLLVASLLLAPGRGMAWALLAERRLAWRIREENLLKDLYTWIERDLSAERSLRGEASTGSQASDYGAFTAVVPWPALMGGRGQSRGELRRLARRLARRGALAIEDDGLRLYPPGIADAAGVVRRHRLWEVFLTRRLELAADHVHRDAEEMEHALSADALRRLDELLGYPSVDPHGRPIPRPAGDREAGRAAA
jgi:manganese/zinc/iron transport system permease protein